MKLLVFALFFACIVSTAYAENTIDQLRARVEKSTGKERVDLLNELAKAYWGVSSDETIANAQKALDLARQLKYDAGQACALRYIGIGYWYKDDYNKSLDFCLKGLVIYERLGDTKGIAGSQNTIGTIYLNLERFDEALKTYQDALAIAEKNGDEGRIGVLLSNIGTTYIGLKKYPEALSCFQRARKILEHSGTQLDQMTNLANIGGVYRRMGRLDEALDVDLKLLKIAKETDSKTRIVDALMDIGEIHGKLGHKAEALDYLTQSIELAKKENLKRSLQDGEQVFVEFYKTQGDYKNALEHQERYVAIRDSILNEESSKSIADMQVKYETKKKEQENFALQKQNQLSAQALAASNKARSLQWVVIFLCMVVGCILAFLMVKQVAHSKVLGEKSREIQEANEKLQEAQERIARFAESAPQALENISAWSKHVAGDLAAVLGAREISIWKMESNQLIPIVEGSGPKPELDTIKNMSTNMVVADGRLQVLAKGISGETYGVIVVEGGRSNDDTAKRLIAGFANQLGGTLEMLQIRSKLAQAEERRAIARQEMKEQGISSAKYCFRCCACYDETVTECENDGTELFGAPFVLPYKIGGRYRLVRKLGEGGMGAVFEAQDETLNRAVSVKVIQAELLGDPLIKIRVRREANTIAKIQHPGVVSIYDFGELPDGSCYILMELLKGEDLRRIVASQGPGTPAQVARVLVQVADALATTHKSGVVHRDLKPENLFLIQGSSGFQIKVLDFGLAKSSTDEISLTMSGVVMGTPAYMPPEQIRGEPVNEQSDLFSLAVVVYELLTGIQTFNGPSLADVFTNILTKDPPLLSPSLPGASAELDDIFAQALAKDREDRPSSLLQWAKNIEHQLLAIPYSISGWNFADKEVTR